MTSTIYTLLKTASQSIQKDPEVELIDCLVDGVMQAGCQADRIDIANFYVALKHRPLAILVGPPKTGKVALVECMANLLAGNNHLQSQVVQGHAWYAGGKPSNTVLIGMHTRMITEKLLSAIEEAAQPENAQQVFIVGLTRISPAELLSCFTEVADQVRNHKRIMRIGDAHLSEPILFPPNLLLIGTLDTTSFNSWDDELLSGATIVKWHGELGIPRGLSTCQPQKRGYDFMRSNLRDNRKAYKKIHSVMAGIKQPFEIVMLLRGVFRTHGIELPPALLNEVTLYLANAWSVRGSGLFDPVTSKNLAIASDLALAQLVLPQSLDAIQASENLYAQLLFHLKERLPRSAALLINGLDRVR